MMNKPGNAGVTRIINAFFYSIKGFKAAFKNEAAFRQELYCLPLVLFFAFYLAKSGIELALMLGSFSLILICELINSALEAVVDRIGIEHHALSGQAKDIGSAIVFTGIALFIITWGSILFYKV